MRAWIGAGFGLTLVACVHANAVPPTCSPTQEPVKTSLVYDHDDPNPEGATYTCENACPEGQRRVLVSEDREAELKLFVFNGKRQRDLRYECRATPALDSATAENSKATSHSVSKRMAPEATTETAAIDRAPLWASPVSATAPPQNSTTSADAWARAREEDAASEGASLDQVESDLALLEQKREPWGDAELARATTCKHVLTELDQRHEGQRPEPRLERDVSRFNALTPRIQRALALAEQRKHRQEVAEAKARAEAERQLLPVCIDCCLKSWAGATRDHCDAACRSNPHSYASFGFESNDNAFVLNAMGITPPQFSCHNP
jgi:hypothetical protein